MPRTVALATAALLWGTTISACSDNEPETSPTVISSASPTSTATPTESTGPTEITEPDPSTDPTKPVLPELAKRHSQAGARAFIEHYVEALNYAFEHNDPSPLRSVSSANCGVCDDLVAAVETLKRRGGEQTGGQWSTTALTFVPTQALDEPIAIVTIQLARGSFDPGPNKPRQRITPQLLNQEYRLSWAGAAWHLEDIRSI